MCMKESKPAAVILCNPETSSNFKHGNSPTEPNILQCDITIVRIIIVICSVVPEAFVSDEMTTRQLETAQVRLLIRRVLTNTVGRFTTCSLVLSNLFTLESFSQSLQCQVSYPHATRQIQVFQF